MLKKVLPIDKSVGQTPLQAIHAFVNDNPGYKGVKLAYAGRLDPMAEGLLLVLVGDECKKRTQYERLPKTYEFSVLWGISTDTYDILGKITSFKMQKVSEKALKTTIESFISQHNQPYPPYSASRVRGKPLYWWARHNRLSDIAIPIKKITIHDLKFKSAESISSSNLKKYVFSRLNKVTGDFRQEEIKSGWEKFFLEHKNDVFQTVSFSINCSSGTYVRSIVHEMGQKLGVGGIALSIKRTQIGDYTLP